MSRPLRCLSALLLTVSAVVHPRAQAPANDDPLAASLADAQKAYAISSWDEAVRKFQSVIDRARERHDDVWEARGVSGLGAVAFGRARYEEARRLLSQSLETFDRAGAWADVSRVEKMLGDVAYLAADSSDARERYGRATVAAERAGDPAARIRAARAIIRLDNDRGLPNAFDAIAQLARDAKALGNPGLEATILHQWADMLFTGGQYEAAIETLGKAAALFESIGQLDDLSTVYNSLGRIFRVHGQPRAALQAQLKALAIQESIDVPYGHVQSLNAVAVTYQTLGEPAKARGYFERALALAEQIGLSMFLPTLRANVGSFLITAGDVVRGRAMIEQTIPDQIPSMRPFRYMELAEADLALGEKERALVDVDRALATCQLGARNLCIYARLAKAQVELASGRDAAALTEQRAAVDQLEQLQSTLAATDFLKQGFSAMWARAHSVAIDLEVRQGNWRAALETAELARARAFVDLIASRESGAHAPGTATDVTWRGAAAGPIAVRSDSSASPSTASDLTATAAHLHTTLLQYWLSDDDLYAWVIAPDGTINGARTAVKRARVEQLVRTVATNTAATERTAGWKALYDVLIRPVEKHLPPRAGARLIVVPHGPLMQLPFAALRDPRGRYLVERFTLASVPSVTMLRYTRARRPADAPPASMLLVADPSSMPVIAGERRLPSLPGALEETRAIARLVPATRTTLLVRANATEPRVLAETPRKNVIHFATHAIVRDVDPWSSFLALGVPGDGAADGKLTAQKIYGLSLDADLVVLSACRSGGGLITGDGIASLARAFFYAGASSMIVSVWDVADEPAKRLLPAFYRSWLAGAEKDRALRSAQLALIRDLRAGRVMVSTPAGDVALVEDPALWAGFVLLGEPD